MIEIQAADDYVYGVLSADATLTGLLAAGTESLFNQNPLISAVPAYIVFDNQTSPDMLTNGNVRVMATFNCVVQAVIYENGSQTKPLADQIASLFQSDLHQEGLAQNGYWIQCYRTKPWNRASQTQNRPYRYVGAAFSLTLRPLTTA